MPYLTREGIEQIADRVIRAYVRLPQVSNPLCRNVNPQILICDLLGLKIEYRRLSLSGCILGETCFDNLCVRVFNEEGQPEYFPLDGRTLLIESDLTREGANTGRLNFTLIHEASHQIFKMLFPREYASSVHRRQLYCCTTSSQTRKNDWEEWRTNALASAILMPTGMVYQNMLAFGLGDKIQMLNRVFEPEVFEQFRSMADFMGVSQKALSIRLKQLGLIEKDFLENPYELIDVFPDEEEMKAM